MVNIAIRFLSVVAGIWAAFASYPFIDDHVVALLAVLAAIAVGVIVGAAFYYLLTWVFNGFELPPRA